MRHSLSEIRLNGIPLSPGMAVGRPCRYEPQISRPGHLPRSPTHERQRLSEALAWLGSRLRMLAAKADETLGREAGDVFRAHFIILEDIELRERLFAEVCISGTDAECAVERHLALYRAQLQALDSEYLRERAADIAELQQALLDRLRQSFPSFRCKEHSGCSADECPLGNDHIVLAPELTPCLTIDIESHTKGFLVEKGGPNSHAAILARALGLPAVSGVDNLYARVPLDAQCLLNGDTGQIILNPSPSTLDRYHHVIIEQRRADTVVDPVPGLKVMANVDSHAGVREALAAKAEGIGLARTEIAALARGRLLTEMEQATLYMEAVQAMAGKPVYIRLLDLGGDKAAPWLGLPTEKNPALGCRGARLLLSRPELMGIQARALARASIHGPIRVVYPMILDLEQFLALRTRFHEALSGLRVGRLLHGVMFEVPSACLQARQLLQEVDFACIGTNDLAQYLFATDRAEESLQYDKLAEKPILWDLLERLVGLAKEAGKPLSLCGELAGNTRFTDKILDTNITAISTDPRHISGVRRAAKAALRKRAHSTPGP